MAVDPRSRTPDDAPPLDEGTRIGCVVSQFHAELVGAMAASARADLESAGLAPDDWIEVTAPGAFELPLVARRLAVREDVAAVLAFGLVLRGETTHDVYIAQAAAQGLMNVALQTDKPIAFGVLTCNTLEQARARALTEAEGGTHDKGREVARAARSTLAAMKAAAERGTAVSPVGFGGPAGFGGPGSGESS